MVKNLQGQSAIGYGALVNQPFLRFAGPLTGTVLDVGCGAGTWASELRGAGATRLLGLEPTDTADLARLRYEYVSQSTIEAVDDALIAEADHIVMADVLEHLLDPWAALAQLRSAVRSGTRLLLSVPNAQNFRVGIPLVLSGKFDYSDLGGVMDRGHVRWFTARTLKRDVDAAGWTTRRQDGVVLGRIATAAMSASRGRAGPVVFHQLHLEATAV